MKIKLLTVLLFTAAFSLKGFNANAQHYFELTFYRNYPNPTAMFCRGCGFYSIGWNASINIIYNMRDYPLNKALPEMGTLNDKFKSVSFVANAGTTITFFNNADGDGSSGSCVVVVKKDVSGYYLTSFERTYEDEYIKVNYWSEHNSLDGKISSFMAY